MNSKKPSVRFSMLGLAGAASFAVSGYAIAAEENPPAQQDS